MKNPNTIIWHCLCHRLELSVADAKASFKQFATFTEVLREIYKFYSQSSKNTAEIKAISAELDQKFQKIGKVFTIRWSASSFNTVKAVKNNLEPLVKHFQLKYIICKEESKKERLRFVLTNLRSKVFSENLNIIYEALEELTILSSLLQKRDLNMIDAHNLIMNSVQVLKNKSEKYCEQSNKDIIDRKKFFFELAKCIKQRSMSTIYRSNMTKAEKTEKLEEYVSLLSDMKICDRKYFPENHSSDYGDEKIQRISKIWGLEETKLKIDFRNYKMFGEIDGEFRKFKDISNTLCISSADAERGFSQMNLIINEMRSNLTIENASNLMLIRCFGMPIDEFETNGCVKMWLSENHNLATCNKNINRSEKENLNDNDFLYKYLK